MRDGTGFVTIKNLERRRKRVFCNCRSTEGTFIQLTDDRKGTKICHSVGLTNGQCRMDRQEHSQGSPSSWIHRGVFRNERV